ncbi:hypothetical protein P0W64_14225 [Tsukamurella sp. 8F]|uniref:hypothetical protein n=1 Tax=unclassified Tsukamurella TaxID=2633480 RepID=UPI0023B8E95D|nr:MULTISPECIES: hypothetical protein [unclassified Tsukamurella]MDF0530731.1 hypothetical protein [Tsukamurella sp. 8J]MDF0587932.1 hypothetical protein [Tsukamurella sp. 8F]
MGTEMMSRAALLATGVTPAGIAAGVRDGSIRRLAHGVYEVGPRGDVYSEYRRRVIAAGLLCQSATVSHQSAAALHGIPAHDADLGLVHMTINHRHGGGIRRGRHIHPRPLGAGDTVWLEGVSATSRARTAIDVATSGDLERAVCAIDAVRVVPRYPDPDIPPPVPPEELAETTDRLGIRPGVRIARQALTLSVEHSESPGESRSRLMMHLWKLPPPRLQEYYHLSGSDYWADFAWDGIIGEFDGYGKYDDRERIKREKQRDSDFRAAGIAVVRWTWNDLADRRRFHALITHALRSAGVLHRVPPFLG